MRKKCINSSGWETQSEGRSKEIQMWKGRKHEDLSDRKKNVMLESGAN
jgi:hypothetical protein